MVQGPTTFRRETNLQVAGCRRMMRAAERINTNPAGTVKDIVVANKNTHIIENVQSEVS